MIDDLQQFTRRYIPDAYHAFEHSIEIPTEKEHL